MYGGGGIEGMSLMLLLHTEEKQTCKCLENCEGDMAVSGSGIRHENVVVCALCQCSPEGGVAGSNHPR